jgi:hypothetical protein
MVSIAQINVSNNLVIVKGFTQKWGKTSPKIIPDFCQKGAGLGIPKYTTFDVA